MKSGEYEGVDRVQVQAIFRARNIRRSRRGPLARLDQIAVQRAVLGGLLKVGRLRRGLVEFLVLPLSITAVLAAGAVLSVLLDDGRGPSSLRQAAESLIPPSVAAGFIGVAATSLMTITSITFSVLLVAVQQTASSLSAVVFDQYLRRRSNQFFLGYFVGATTFTFIVDASAGSGRAPVHGALATLVLTIGCLVSLLLLIHSTVDQMRPECVVRSIHRLALRARERELLLITATRRNRETAPGTETRDVRTVTSGYVVGIDAVALTAVARSIGPAVEILLPAQMGTYLQVGQTVAQVAGLAASDDGWDADVLRACTLDDTRRVEVDSAYAIDQLENIAWMTGTSAAQSPYTASAAIHALGDLVGRWASDQRRERISSRAGGRLPVVYPDRAVQRTLSAFGSLLIASSESRQTNTAALIITSFSRALPRLPTERHRIELVRSLDAALPSVTQQAELPSLTAALAELVEALELAGHDPGRVQRVQAVLRIATDRLRPEFATSQTGPTDAPRGTPRG